MLGIDYEIGTSLVCDTRGQVERFVALYSGDMKDTIKLVNAEEHDAFVRGTELGTARHGDDAFQVVHILIVGVSTDNGVQAVRPAAYYSLFRIKEIRGLTASYSNGAKARTCACRSEIRRPSKVPNPLTSQDVALWQRIGCIDIIGKALLAGG